VDIGFLIGVIVLIGLFSAMVSQVLGRGTGPVVFLLVFSTFSGYLNNLYDRHPLIHIGRFAILAAIAVFWLVSRERVPIGRTPVDKLVWYFFCYYALHMFNPHWSGPRAAILNGLVGLATHGFPILLFFIGREIIRTPRQIAGVFQLLIALSVVMGIYGVYQYVQGYEYVAGLGPGFRTTLNREMLWRDDNAAIQVFRPVSFAPDAGTASSFYAVGILLSGALLTGGRLGFFSQWAMMAGMVVMFAALWLTAVRSSMIGTVVGLGLVVATGRKTARIGIALMGLGALLWFVQDPSGGMLTDRFRTGFTPTEVMRSRGQQLQAVWWVMTTFPTGMGIGRGGPAAGKFNEPEDNQYSFPPESYFVTIGFECGVPGVLFAVLIFFKFAYYCTYAVTRVRDPELHPLALAISVVICATMLVSFVGCTLYAAPLCYLFWTLSGLLFRVLELETAAREKALAMRAKAKA
jgi:hypothetical protein